VFVGLNKCPVCGTKLKTFGKKIEEALRKYDKTLSVFADQASAGYYIDIIPNADKLVVCQIDCGDK